MVAPANATTDTDEAFISLFGEFIKVSSTQFQSVVYIFAN